MLAIKTFLTFFFFSNALDHFGKHPCWVPCRLPTPLMYKVHAVCTGSLNSDRLASKLALRTPVTDKGTSTLPAVCAERV